ncbi:MAG: 2-amino-4-hydroxy-6-hydroxymethyldihydropteridine diphosphokinase [Candidatus Omnitrophota bacterium]|nr:2-amino-4-hydroxy-6-hydroxymethyldihydropteridine diphosphokinase [Candidatus Omnitrophota bacterium]MBU1894487.1 2-amino-4-hydroxy-6-hydroxymethyldihydropteridine diphosphokinase [Candidatus Omnitrophota bacterium]
MTVSYLGLGSNLGDKKKHLELAVKKLASVDGIEIIEKSTFYVTKPVDGPVQGDYLNGVVKIKTTISPGCLIGTLKNIESEMGRCSCPRNYPRIIDIDILFYGNAIINTETLIIPHPRMHKRYFVLKGLVEIAPDEVHPVYKKTVSEIYENMLAGCFE